ncbi:hypothetical protein DCO58_05150 [Helicobacter saguini]|uniref:Lipopolysaccharide heptosyltransferase family protein n=1 Tax=Helicobacter saguini TaxID=1548018 RepID=A0A347W3F0_9HELI|nr:hypothetical protein [Helicobacter saguini]MWV62263.1 hypothetical protein [Helicobacter saguini]MWV67064.1 hypothetical protein [Helicobacter saguini]MWV69414.1 hypothetical protein [Helicobacter saguini]MWV71032.1 hypothetical protein [Helicobacter saguini]TLD95062.1 hypothetical protein LS64_003910 [Helicobacter saguini]
MNIGMYKAGLIGDSIVALHAIYALKILYPNAKIHIYTNDIGVSVYKNFSFINSLINISQMPIDSVIADIDSKDFTHFILTQPNRSIAKVILKTKLRKIITFRTFFTFFEPRFKTIFFSRNFGHTPQYKRNLALVRLIDSKLYDKKIKSIDFSPIRMHSLDFNKEKIRQFLIESFGLEFYQNIESKSYKNHNFIESNLKDSKDSKNHNMLNKNFQDSKLILINPFVRTTFCNLTLNGWINCIKILSDNYPQHRFVIPTFSGNPSIAEQIKMCKNVAIFNNDSDLCNIVALLELSDLLISPSTGISHIADNLAVPIIWLCSKRDTWLWRGENMDPVLFVIMDETQWEVKPQKERYYITQILVKSYHLLEYDDDDEFFD